jgi:hypothetical protein
LLKRSETHSWREELLNRRRQRISGEITLTEILTVNKVTKQSNLGTLAYKIKCNCRKPDEENSIEAGGEKEPDCA